MFDRKLYEFLSETILLFSYQNPHIFGRKHSRTTLLKITCFNVSLAHSAPFIKALSFGLRRTTISSAGYYFFSKHRKYIKTVFWNIKFEGMSSKIDIAEILLTISILSKFFLESITKIKRELMNNFYS
ncbi:hypothetical protein BpHYR1_030299 [Brachionus plicatilis]|uniref:Uncharacterized protein n=1 Tax=Brachionus plicatilis TaxID=10195 RepID=A0A3M7PMX2_BRAPC|nr:hypothetical protein BpHYR1_030299 [Brachionus plicatilis]